MFWLKLGQATATFVIESRTDINYQGKSFINKNPFYLINLHKIG